jgi:hypothetical protein
MPITNLKDKARGLAGLHEMVRVYLIEEAYISTGTLEWPKLSDIAVGGDITAAIPFQGTPSIPQFLMSPQSGEGEYKKEKGAGPGYEKWGHGPLKGMLVGDTAAQQKTMMTANNMPFIAIAEYENGDRQVYGTLRKPCQVEFATKKNKDGDTIEVTISSQYMYSFAPPHLAAGVAITLLA